MAQLPADGESGLMVQRVLFRSQILCQRPAGGRTWPAGQFLVAVLSVGVAQAVHVV